MSENFSKFQKIDDIDFKKKKKLCDFEEIFFLEMIKDKDTNFLTKKKNFKLSIPSFKFQISKKKKKKIFFKELQESIKVFLLKMKKFKSRRNKGIFHITKDNGTTKHSSFKSLIPTFDFL